MRALFDVNVLIALLDSDHIGHKSATAWYEEHLKGGWASCPISENGAARVMSGSGYPNAVAVSQVLKRLGQAQESSDHEFWPDDLSLTNATVFRHDELLGPKQITDRYLLALAVKHRGRLVTFDRAIRPTAVEGATGRNLVQIEG
jgi:toxin-antitoxin system PIN domain toxin